MRDRIYFDNNATTAPHPEVVEQVKAWLQEWGNPSSIHEAGRGPKRLLREARQSFSKLIHCDPLEVVFTASGSECNNTAIKGFYFQARQNGILNQRRRFVFGPVEHPSVFKEAKFLEREGCDVKFLSIRRDGSLDIQQLNDYLSVPTALVSVQLANNETGTIFPIQQLAELAHSSGALFHTDAVQALGKMVVDVKDLGVDMASFAGHKFYTLKGVGALYIKKGVTLEPLVYGGGHERGRRGGTENVLAIASLGAMAEKKNEILEAARRVCQLRDALETKVIANIPTAEINAKASPRLPNTSSLIIPGMDGEVLLMNLDMEGISVSTGAACSSGSQEPSPNLRTMGLSREEAQSSLRISLSWNTTLDEVDRFCEILFGIYRRLSADRSQVPEIFSQEGLNG